MPTPRGAPQRSATRHSSSSSRSSSVPGGGVTAVGAARRRTQARRHRRPRRAARRGRRRRSRPGATGVQATHAAPHGSITSPGPTRRSRARVMSRPSSTTSAKVPAPSAPRAGGVQGPGRDVSTGRIGLRPSAAAVRRPIARAERRDRRRAGWRRAPASLGPALIAREPSAGGARSARRASVAPTAGGHRMTATCRRRAPALRARPGRGRSLLELDPELGQLLTAERREARRARTARARLHVPGRRMGRRPARRRRPDCTSAC